MRFRNDVVWPRLAVHDRVPQIRKALQGHLMVPNGAYRALQRVDHLIKRGMPLPGWPLGS